MNRPLISQRKEDHLEICATRPVEFQETSTWLEHVRLIHQALPDLAVEDIELETELFGKRLAAPVFVGAMTGGSQSGSAVNRELAGLVEDMGLGMGLGSMRPALRHPETLPSFQLRPLAPSALLIGNLGLQQARELPDETVLRLMTDTGLDALAIHLNPGMELFQAEGDRDFRGGFQTLRRLSALLGPRLVVKETGCGIARETAQRLKAAGVQAVDVAGAGGTSWIRVECLRSPDSPAPGEQPEPSPFEEWGVPTAACLIDVAPLGFRVIASGGIRNGLDAARAIALGAGAVSMALPVLRALRGGGVDAVRRYLTRFIQELRAAMLLSGCRTLAELRRQPKMLTGPLREWEQARK